MKNLTPEGPILIGSDRLYLYEVTDKDITFSKSDDYFAGQILLFDINNPKKVRLGAEIGSAESIEALQQHQKALSPTQPSINMTASQYFESSSTVTCFENASDVTTFNTEPNTYEHTINDLKTELENIHSDKAKLLSQIDYLNQVIETLRSLSDNVDSVKAENNDLLYECLSSHSQQLEDLAQKNAEITHRYNQELSTSLAYEIERNLLVDRLLRTQSYTDNPVNNLDEESPNDVFTYPGGSVTIYHEFKRPEKPSLAIRVFGNFRYWGYFVAVTAVVFYVIYTTSVFRAMSLDGIPVREYSGAFVDYVKSLFGF